MDEVARLANVSKPTVSRALSGSDLVNEKTKKHVLEVAQKYGYSVNRNAQKLRQSRSNTIAVSVDFQSYSNNHISDPFIFELLAGVSEALSDQGKDLLLCSHNNNDTDSLNMLLSSRTADGIIFLGQGHREETFEELSRFNTPFVVWGASIKGMRYGIVGSDNFLGGQLAGQHFELLQRRKLLFVGDPSYDEMGLRKQGLEQHAKGYGAELTDLLVNQFSFDAVSLAMEDYISENGFNFDGVFAWSDTGAMAVIRVLIDHGCKVPDDVSVIGYNDIQSSAHFAPSITTIRQDTVLAGEALVAMMLDVIEGKPVGSKTISTELVVRTT